MKKNRAITSSAGKSLRLMVMLLMASVFSFGQSNSNEYNVKAMFVLNFMKYIEWPGDVSSIRIGVLGESDIMEALINMTKNRPEPKKITVEQMDESSTGNYCIIIIPKNHNKKYDDLLRKYQNKGVLIVADEGKSSDMAAINLLTIENKIKFEINYSQARFGGVKISSRLADLAITVYP